MDAEKPARLHAIVKGRVQGVGFRAFVLNRAQGLGLSGWVRNRWDDTVEVTAEGDRQKLERLLDVLRRGPSSAYVSDVQYDWGTATGEYRRFGVLPTE